MSELAAPFGISLTGMRKHVRVLEEAELGTTEKVGRSRRCRADQMDVTAGGVWRFVIRNADRSETGFRGTYREVSPPERVVQTLLARLVAR